MNNWPYKANDLAIANSIIMQMASHHERILRFVEDCYADEKADTFRFTLSAWVRVLIQTWRAHYLFNELGQVLGKVLAKLLKLFGILKQQEAELFKTLCY